MFNEDCYPNGSYINHLYITPNTPDTSYYISHLQCVLPNSTLSGGEWVYPNGQPVNCNNSTRNNPLRCIKSNTLSNITVYRPDGDNFHESDLPIPDYNKPLATRSLFTFTVTWYGEEINSGIFSQSNNNGDHVHRCYVRVEEIIKNRYITVTGKYFYYYSYMMSYVILSAPGFIPSPPTLINMTATTITVSWTPVLSDADGYVVNATSDSHTVTQQVKGPASNVISVQTNINLTTGIDFNVLFDISIIYNNRYIIY